VRREALAIIVLALGAWAAPSSPPQAQRGWPLYERLCLPCHGARGDGHGPAAPYVWPSPRAFTRDELKWRLAPVGQPATDDDVRTTIRLGAPGTSMPGFGDVLTPAQLDDVLAIVRGFAPGAFGGAAQPIALGPPPPPDPVRGAALWRAKGCPACHGITGDGHGPSSAALRAPPYDLTTGLHRPRAPGPEAYRLAAARSIAAGLAGTTMPSYAGTLGEADLWALADHVVAIARRTGQRDDRRAMNPATIDADRTARIPAGTWPGLGAPEEAAVFGAPIAPQGPPPPNLAPAQASLHARQCARCHATQYRAWETSLHRGAVSPGLLAQTEYGMAAAERRGCLRCHAPLAEQADNAALRSDSISCAGCHVRGWVRHGPPNVAPSLLPIPGYPLVTVGLYERADFCLPCHQLPPRNAVAGRPLLNTYKEWLEGPYMPRGVQCQHCHMPNREHAFLGIHDPPTFRQGIELTASAQRRGAKVTAVATLKNIGAGHYLPTTPTPAAWLSITLVDASGRPIAGASHRHRIGRDIWFDGTWHERADTRIPPGEAITVARAWTSGRTAQATAARIAIEVHPDDYYERFYTEKLAGRLVPAQRALYQQALTRALGARYLAEQRDVPIQP
jgi:mono/diheme cytochrome c family protein